MKALEIDSINGSRERDKYYQKRYFIIYLFNNTLGIYIRWKRIYKVTAMLIVHEGPQEIPNSVRISSQRLYNVATLHICILFFNLNSIRSLNQILWHCLIMRSQTWSNVYSWRYKYKHVIPKPYNRSTNLWSLQVLYSWRHANNNSSQSINLASFYCLYITLPLLVLYSHILSPLYSLRSIVIELFCYFDTFHINILISFFL